MFFDSEIISVWLAQYGSIVLFSLLFFGILALPVPEEALMVVAGVFIAKNTLSLVPTLFAAYAGSICGISMSYLLGKTIGPYVLEKLSKISFVHNHLKQAQEWFDRFGKWSLLIGYFIPGVRHFTGFSAGMMKMPFKLFALFAYMGAFIWASLFISTGFFLESYCSLCNKKFDLDRSVALLVFAVVLAYFGLVKLKSLLLKKK